MLDSTIHSKTLLRQFRKADFRSSLWTVNPTDKDDIIAQAKQIAVQGFNTVSLRHNTISGKPIFRQSSLAECLLTRHVSESIRRVTSVRQSDRNAIITSLVQLCAEGIPFNVVKMDIKSFYESVIPENIVKALKADPAFSRQSIFVLESFFEALNRQQIAGLPRGIGLSATLAEFVMRTFDRSISGLAGVRYYSRYVDDSIAITSVDVDPLELIEHAKLLLPRGLSLNRLKTKPFQCSVSSRNSTGELEQTINFLGYEIAIYQISSVENRLKREVRLDIAQSKVSRIKRRLSKSFLDFNNGGSFDKLLDRVKLLTSNYGYVDQSNGMQRYAGLRYNYGLINPNTSKSLESLDRFLRNTLMSPHPNNRIRPNVSPMQRHQLLGLSFTSGFKSNRFFTFEPDKLTGLIDCWSHA